MSLTILLIALVPAAAVVAISAKTQSRVAVGAAGVVAVLIGIGTGNPVYAAFDVGAAVAATWFSWPALTQAQVQKKQQVKQEREAYYASQAYQDDIKRAEINVWSIIVFGVIAYLVWIFGLPNWGTPTAKRPSALPMSTQAVSQPPPAVGYSSPFDRCKGSVQVDVCEREERRLMSETPEQAAARRAALETNRAAAMTRVNGRAHMSDESIPPAKVGRGNVPQKTVSYCLTLSDETKMNRCLESAR